VPGLDEANAFHRAMRSFIATKVGVAIFAERLTTIVSPPPEVLSRLDKWVPTFVRKPRTGRQCHTPIYNSSPDYRPIVRIWPLDKGNSRNGRTKRWLLIQLVAIQPALAIPWRVAAGALHSVGVSVALADAIGFADTHGEQERDDKRRKRCQNSLHFVSSPAHRNVSHSHITNEGQRARKDLTNRGCFGPSVLAVNISRLAGISLLLL
jgi:hypothetical protein